MLLMHENTPVIDVEIYLGQITKVNQVINPEHLPIGTNHQGILFCQYLNTWLKERAIPYNRKSLEVYTKYFNNAPLEAAQIFGSFSLTDHYWFKEKNSLEKWEDLCFQKNGFSNAFSDYFFETMSGCIPMGEKIPFVPDANTAGVLPKIWISDNVGNPKLIKFGEHEYTDNCHILCANEVACSRIAEMMQINAVHYEKITIPGIPNPICICPNFISTDMEFVTAAQIARECAGTKFDLYEKICEMGYKKELEEMLRFFFLIHNKDGHTKNFGFLRNAKTLKIEAFAPLFDNGCSLNYDGLGSLDKSVKPFRETRLEQISLIENLGDAPDFNKISEIIKETYTDFNVPDEQLDLALEDLIETHNEWEKIIESDREQDENTYEQ